MAKAERNNAGQWSVSVVSFGDKGEEIPGASYAVDQHKLISSLRSIHGSHSGTPENHQGTRDTSWRDARTGRTNEIRVSSPEGHRMNAHGFLNGGEGWTNPEDVEYHRQAKLDQINNDESDRLHRAAKEGLPHSGTDALLRGVPTATSPEGVELSRRVASGEGPERHTTAMDNWRKASEARKAATPSDRSGDSNRSFGSTDGHFAG